MKESAKIKTKTKKYIVVTYSQCAKIGHSKTLCPFIKPEIEKQIISKQMRVDWTATMSTWFDVQKESNKYEIF